MKHGRPQWGEEANVGAAQARVQGGGAPCTDVHGALEIKKQKKRSSEQI